MAPPSILKVGPNAALLLPTVWAIVELALEIMAPNEGYDDGA